MARIREKICGYLKKINYIENKTEWAFVIIILGFAMLTMFYSDFQGTMDYAYQTFDQVMHGKIWSIKYISTHPYGITMAFILMLWMVPFYPFTLLSSEKFWYFGSLAAAVWSKLFLSVITVFCLVAVYKIAKLYMVKKENIKWLPIFMLTSAFYFIPVVEIGQCDIVSLAFMMWGIYYYLKNDTRKFLLFFAIAIPIKYFPLMIFIPLVLLHEKNPIKIIIQVIEGCSILIINILLRKIWFGTFLGEFATSSLNTITSTVTEIIDDAVSEAATPEISGTVAGVVSDAVDTVTNAATTEIVREVVVESKSLENFLGPFIANSSIFVVSFILICVFAYAIKAENKQKWTIYISALVYAAFFGMTSINIYWTVLIMPFLALLIFTNSSQLRLGMILETVAGWALTFASVFKWSWLVGGEKTFSYLFLRGNENGADLGTFLGSECGLEGLSVYAYSAYVACMIGILAVNAPCFANKAENAGDDVKVDRWIIWIRIGILFVWCALLVYLFFMR